MKRIFLCLFLLLAVPSVSVAQTNEVVVRERVVYVERPAQTQETDSCWKTGGIVVSILGAIFIVLLIL